MSEPQLETPVSSAPWGGEALRSTLRFLAVPGALGVLVTVFGVPLPIWVLYGIGAIFGVAMVVRVLSGDPDCLMAVAIIYLPLNKMFVVPIGPGINGTNIVLALLVFSWFRHPLGQEDPHQGGAPPAPASSLVRAYALVTLASVLTAAVTVGPYFVREHAIDIKWWLDQFIVFFTFLRLIHDGDVARRMVVYMMLGSMVVVALGFHEWLDKRGASSIEKARLLGPQMQPNDFGAFLAYSSAPFIALLLNNIRRIRTLVVVVPYLLMTTRVVLATFSRGSYLGMALAGIVAGYVRGKLFLLGAALVGLVLVFAVPELVPTSLQARMSHTPMDDGGGGGKLDTSSQTRLILWEAGLKMTLSSPVFGWGFGTFPKLKGEYTETPVEESDNHNMYLYLSSQMGIPALLLFAMILWRMASLGMRIYRKSDEGFARVVGMTAPAMAAAVFLVNMFGSRMVDICVSVHFWITLAVVSRLWAEIEQRNLPERVR